jgi:dienelactone hydrolase
MRRCALAVGLVLLAACSGSTPPPHAEPSPAVSDAVLFKNGDVVAYAVKKKDGAVVGRTHSTYYDQGEGTSQVLTRVAIGEASSESVVTLHADLSPSQFKLLSSSEGRVELRFKDRSVAVISESGVQETPYARNDAVLVPTNDLMTLALVLRRAHLKPGTSLELALLSPRTLKSDPARVQVYADAEGKTVVALPQGRAFVDPSGRIQRFEFGDQGVSFEREDPPGDPPKVTAPAEPLKYVRPVNASWRDRDVSIDVRDGRLEGTLSEPRKTPAPGVLFLSADAQDRHGFSQGIDVGTWQILDRLADEGFAVLRTDDRGGGLDDAKAKLKLMRTQPAVHPNLIFVIGHDKGALTAMRLAAEDELAGVVAIAPPFHAADHDDQKALAKIEEDVAVFQGMKDIHVSWKADAKPLVDALNKQNKKRAKLFVYENVDHMMKSEPGESSARHEADRSRRIDGGFLDDLVRWLKARSKQN